MKQIVNTGKNNRRRTQGLKQSYSELEIAVCNLQIIHIVKIKTKHANKSDKKSLAAKQIFKGKGFRIQENPGGNQNRSIDE